MIKNKSECFLIGLASVILGIIVGILTYTVAIPGIVIAIAIALGIALGTFILLTLIATFAPRKNSQCVCRNGKCVAVGAIGTIITTIIALAITIVTASIATAILIGFVTFFSSLTVFSFLKLILCFIEANCVCRE